MFVGKYLTKFPVGSANCKVLKRMAFIFSIRFTMESSARKFVSPNIHSQVFAHKLVNRKGWGTCRSQKAIREIKIHVYAKRQVICDVTAGVWGKNTPVRK